jgi:hypothetical protein
MTLQSCEAKFQFGANRRRFLKRVREPNILAARQSLEEMLCLSYLREKSFLNVGSGSGLLYIALYNDQGGWSRIWWLLKSVHCQLRGGLNTVFAYTTWYLIVFFGFIKSVILFCWRGAARILRDVFRPKTRRGMQQGTDILDWMGGMPFKVVEYNTLVEYMRVRGFVLERGTPNPGHGCREWVFRHVAA